MQTDGEPGDGVHVYGFMSGSIPARFKGWAGGDGGRKQGWASEIFRLPCQEKDGDELKKARREVYEALKKVAAKKLKDPTD